MALAHASVSRYSALRTICLTAALWLATACAPPEQTDFAQYFEAVRTADFMRRHGVKSFIGRGDGRILTLSSGETIFLRRDGDAYQIGSVQDGQLTEDLRARVDSIVASVRRFHIIAMSNRDNAGQELLFTLDGIASATLPKVPIDSQPVEAGRVRVGVLLYAPNGLSRQYSSPAQAPTGLGDGWYYEAAYILSEVVN